MKIICAWCQKLIGHKWPVQPGTAEAGAADNDRATHTICKECRDEINRYVKIVAQHLQTQKENE